MLKNNFSAECQKLFYGYKSMVFNETNLSEKNKKIKLEYFPYFNDMFGKYQKELSEMLIDFHKKENPHDSIFLEVLKSIGDTYVAKFVELMDGFLDDKTYN